MMMTAMQCNDGRNHLIVSNERNDDDDDLNYNDADDMTIIMMMTMMMITIIMMMVITIIMMMMITIIMMMMIIIIMMRMITRWFAVAWLGLTRLTCSELRPLLRCMEGVNIIIRTINIIIVVIL